MRAIALILSAGLFAGVAVAEESKDKTPTPADAKPQAPSAAQTPSAAPEPAKPEPEKPKREAKPESKPRPAAMSRDAYAGRVAAELRRHTPSESQHRRPGTVKVSFTIGASGRVTSHKILQSSDPSLETTVAKILAAVHAPPPPDGSFSASQEFRFK